MSQLQHIKIEQFSIETGSIQSFDLSYHVFGQPIGNAPVVVVNHALTGSSNVAGEMGWWTDIIGFDKVINLKTYTVIALNIPGNGYDGNSNNLIENYKDYTIRDVAKLFWEGLHLLGITNLHSVIGGSLGGAISWEMTVLNPKNVEHLIPIATDWKATDWVIANVLIQDQILNNSSNPISDARLHAMTLYRTPQSINQRFGLQKVDNKNLYQIENWLINHGTKLQNRFRLEAYKLMNNLLRTNDITRSRNPLEEIVQTITTAIHVISVDTDYFFTADQNLETYNKLKPIKNNIYYHEINSIHGHDAFLIEYEQLIALIQPIFN
jgi:homoserine O-acetyltransferase